MVSKFNGKTGKVQCEYLLPTHLQKSDIPRQRATRAELFMCLHGLRCHHTAKRNHSLSWANRRKGYLESSLWDSHYIQVST